MQAQIFHLAVLVLFMITFTEASLSKLVARETPEWFRNQFKNTLLGKLPLPLLWWSIALMELAVAGLFITATALMEFKTGTPNTYTGWGCLAAMGLFMVLLFGQRLSRDYAGAANSFFYASFSGILWYVLQNIPT